MGEGIKVSGVGLRGTIGAATLVLVLMLQTGAARSDAPEVTVDAGTLVGARDGNVIVFKGIPYAKPPVGPLRWKPTEKPEPWTGKRDATAFGPICPQPERPGGRSALMKMMVGGDGTQSEDCLTLNVWAPATPSKAVPVMVWIHGGGHAVGSATQKIYDGSSFAKDGVILVSIQYRLGQLGYFAHPALTAEAGPDAPLGNYGLMDQMAALAWVKRNIAAFGGDPGNVTVFGESAGAASTLYLLTTPAARGLFEKAIVESGGGWAPTVPLAAKEKMGVSVIDGIGYDGANATAAELRAIPFEKLVLPPKGPGFGPFVDGRLVMESPTHAIEEGHAAKIPVVIGSNSDEGSITETFGIEPTMVSAAFDPGVLPELHKLYPDKKDDAAFARQVYGDGLMGAPSRWVARMLSSHGSPAWHYFFSYTTKRQREKSPGARHGSEILYVFASWDKIPLASFLVHDEDKVVIDEMHGAWVAFAKTGRPEVPGGLDWPEYSADRDVTMEFGLKSGARSGIDKARFDFQERYSKLYRAATR